jgi:hypothetical protein
MGVPRNHPILNRIFHYKPSILGYTHLWNPPSVDLGGCSNAISTTVVSREVRIVLGSTSFFGDAVRGTEGLDVDEAILFHHKMHKCAGKTVNENVQHLQTKA